MDSVFLLAPQSCEYLSLIYFLSKMCLSQAMIHSMSAISVSSFLLLRVRTPSSSVAVLNSWMFGSGSGRGVHLTSICYGADVPSISSSFLISPFSSLGFTVGSFCVW